MATVWVSFKSMFVFLVSGHLCLAVSQQVQSVPVCVISVLVTDNFMLSSLHFEECENHLKYFSFHINLLPCYASHHLKQVSCLVTSGYYISLHTTLVFKLLVFSMPVVSAYLPVLFCTYKEYKPVITSQDSNDKELSEQEIPSWTTTSLF